MTIETKDLFQTAIALSVYISAVRLYAETQLHNKEIGPNKKNIINVLLFLVTIPDVLMIVTALGALYSLIYEVEINKVFFSTFIAGVVALVILHVIEWIRNIGRFVKLGSIRSAVSQYLTLK